MPRREIVESVLKALLDQVPGMTVRKITLTPSEPAADEEVTAQIDVVDGGSVICTISADGCLASACVFEPQEFEPDTAKP